MPLRDYQIEALGAIKSAWQDGVCRQLVVAPTGVGKTEIFAHIPEYIGLGKGEQLMLLVHRNELVDQAAKRFQKYNPNLKVSIERAHMVADADADIVVASVATIGKYDSTHPEGYSRRLLGFSPDRIKYLVIDEIHHAPGNASYLNVIRYFGLAKTQHPAGRLLLGFTATPSRGDNIGLDAVLDKIVFTRDIREMITAGWLVPITAFRVETFLSLDDVKVSHGDFQTKSLEETIDTPERNQLIVDKYRELGGGKQGIAFTVDVKHSHDLAAQFRKNGIVALPLSGDTPDEERQRILAAYSRREIAVVTSCGVLNEGVDIPIATVGMMARPTKSGLLFRQQLGRLLRTHDGKQAAIIIDFVDNSYKHRLVTLPTLFGLPPDFDVAGDVIDTLEEVEEIQEDNQIGLAGLRSLTELRSLVESLDLLRPPTIPEHIKALTPYSWLCGLSDSYSISIPGADVLSIRETALGFDVVNLKNGVRVPIYVNVASLETAFKLADALIPADVRRMLNSGAKWRTDPPSDKQIRALARLDKEMYSRFGGDMQRFSTYIRSAFTKGDVSNLIDQRITTR